MKKILKNKKRFIAVFLLCLVTVGLTVALAMVNTDPLTNSFSIGEIDTEIHEDNVTATDGVINKAPQVKNNSNNPALVRVKMVISPSNMITVSNDGQDSNANLIINSDYWTYNEEDGYYYYNTVLKGNEFTEPLFTHINGIINSDNKFIDGKDAFDVTIYQESIQTSAVKNGVTIDAYENNQYNQGIAEDVWEIYDSLSE